MLARRSTPDMPSVQRKRKRVEECFGWLKTIALLRKVRHRGVFKVGWVFTFAAAVYNLVRLRNLAMQAP
jgi:IS5 family transposase